MNGYKRLAGLTTILAASAFGCAPDQEAGDAGMMEEPSTAVEQAESAMTVQFDDFRMEMNQALGDIREELSGLQTTLSEDGGEAWIELSDSAEETTSEVMADLGRLSNATAEEARSIQRAASDRLAELEADVVHGEISATDDARSLSETVDERLTDLEADIETIDDYAMESPPADRVPNVPSNTGQQVVAEEDVANLRMRLDEARSEAAELGDEAGEELTAAREDIGETVAELTRDVRRQWYRARWRLETPA